MCNKIIRLVLISTFVVAILFLNVLSLEIEKPELGKEIPKEDILFRTKINGDFECLKYVITDIGATSGIRYRTKEITFELNGMKGTLPATELINHKPDPGVKVTSIVSIDTKDLVKIFGEKNKAKVEEALKSPENLKIGANIEVYNAKTKESLVSITDEDYQNNTIYDKIKKYGFHYGHVENMESRWHGHEQIADEPVYDYVPKPKEPDPEPPKSYGVRPGFWREAEGDEDMDD